jgi:hypothetical protein
MLREWLRELPAGSKRCSLALKEIALPVCFFAVADPENSNRRAAVIDVVENAIDSDANPPVPFAVFQFLASRWAWVFSQCQKSLFDRFVPGRRNGIVVFLGHRQDDYPVSHLRFRRFSARACSKGIGVSPRARASSHARTSSRSSSSSRIFSYSSMLIMTATFSPRSFTTNWRSFPMEISLTSVYSRAEERAIQTSWHAQKCYSSSEEDATLRTARKASWGMST